MDVHVVVLAAGKGTRMKSARAKVLHEVAGLPLIAHVLRASSHVSPKTTTLVVGHQADAVRQALARSDGLTLVVQEPQLGTAHALLMAESALKNHRGTVVLLSGDVPLLKGETLESLVKAHVDAGAAATVITATVPLPQGYGRIVRDGEQIAKIVEEKDATEAERAIAEINSGIYAFALEGLFDALRGVAAENAQREFYLPDLIAIFRKQGRTVTTVPVGTADEILGINSRQELATVAAIMRAEKNAALMASGVTLVDPATTYVHTDVRIGQDTILHPNVSIEGTTTIGIGCEIHSGVRIVNCTIGDHSVILNHSVIAESTLADHVSVGPFAHFRTTATLAAGAKVGNFVEMKNTKIGPKSKAMHLSYLGDTVIGSGVNIGAGTITCNYDGTRKQTTTIEDGAFIGSDTQLIAPVTVGKDAYVGTGTTVRQDVPGGALAVSAGKQRNIEGWVEKRRNRKIQN